MSDLWLAGKRLRLDPSRAFGKGGEADVYDLGDGRALKVFKDPAHADYAGLPAEQAAAAARLDEHQHKLRAFPQGLPAEVVAPDALALGKQGEVRGYAMRLVPGAEPLLRFAEPAFRAAASCNQVLAVFRALRDAVSGLHARAVTIGDFSDLNVLVRGGVPALIDADSFQFGPYPCRVFTERFLDPLASAAGRPVAPFRPETDWYAFAALLMQSLLSVGPWGGIYRPRDPSRRMPASARPAARITVFHPEVQYPRPAAPLSTLPDDLLHALHLVFERDLRAPLPLALLEARFARCAGCGLEHARASCPACAPHASAQAQTAVVVRGRVTATTLREGPGRIVHACAEGGEPRWLWHDGQSLRRENGDEVLRAPLDPSARYRLQGARTLIGVAGSLRAFGPAAPTRTMAAPAPASAPAPGSAQAYGLDGAAAWDCSEGRLVWASAGALLREGPHGPERLGDVLSQGTRLWLGPSRGFGVYQAGEISVAFLFDPARRGLDDGVQLPRRPGRLLAARCVFAGPHAWFFQARREHGSTVHRCLQLGARGEVLAEAEAEEGDGSWLGTPAGAGPEGFAGACAAEGLLLCATDAGLVRVEARAGRLLQTCEFPDTAPFVDAGSSLFLSRQGVCATRLGRLTALRLAI